MAAAIIPEGVRELLDHARSTRIATAGTAMYGCIAVRGWAMISLQIPPQTVAACQYGVEYSVLRIAAEGTEGTSAPSRDSINTR